MKLHARNLTYNNSNKNNSHFGAELSDHSRPFSVRATHRTSTTYVCDIWDVLEELSDIEDTLFVLGIAEEEDRVVIRLNCLGGSLYVADALIQAMANCPAHIHVQASGIVASAATFVLLEADSFNISPFCNILCHSASFGSVGKQVDVLQHASFQFEQAEKVLRHYYADFLTEKEIDNIIYNKHEMFLTADDWCERYDKRNSIRNIRDNGGEYKEGDTLDVEALEGDYKKVEDVAE